MYIDPEGLNHANRPDGKNCVDPDGSPAYCPRNPCATAECAADLPPAQHDSTPLPPVYDGGCMLKCIAKVPTCGLPGFAGLACRVAARAACNQHCKKQYEKEKFDKFNFILNSSGSEMCNIE